MLISSIPLYYLAKLLFVIWLMKKKGATTLYIRFVMPVIKKHEESIDNALMQGYKKSETTLVDLKRRSLAFLRERGIYTATGKAPKPRESRGWIDLRGASRCERKENVWHMSRTPLVCLYSVSTFST